MITFHVDGAELEGKSDSEIDEIMHKHAIDAIQKAHYYTARVRDESVGVRMPGCEYMLTVEEARRLVDSIEDALDHLDGTIEALKEAIKDPPVRTLENTKGENP